MNNNDKRRVKKEFERVLRKNYLGVKDINPEYGETAASHILVDFKEAKVVVLATPESMNKNTGEITYYATMAYLRIFNKYDKVGYRIFEVGIEDVDTQEKLFDVVGNIYNIIKNKESFRE